MTSGAWPTIVVELSFGGAAGNLLFNDTVRGLFDTGTFGSIGFTDVTDYTRGFATSMGRARALENYQPARMSILLSNLNNDFDPANLSGRYVAAGVTQVRPMIPARISAIYSGTSYPLGYTYIDSVETAYPGGGKDAVASFAGTDGFKVLNQFVPAGPSAPAGAGEDAGARITRILDNAGWSNALRDIDTGNSTVQDTPLTMGALEEIQGVTASEQGYFFQAPDGRMTFRKRQTRLTATRSTVVQATWGNGGGSLLPYTDIVFAYDDQLVKNTISAQISGGTVQETSDSTSVGAYLTQTYNASNLWLETDLDALDFAEWILWRYKDAELRVESITVNPRRNDALWPVVLGARYGDLHTVTHTTPGGTTVSRNLFVEGIDHQVTADRTWATTLRFSSATNETASPWFVFDTSLFNTGALAPL